VRAPLPIGMLYLSVTHVEVEAVWQDPVSTIGTLHGDGVGTPETAKRKLCELFQLLNHKTWRRFRLTLTFTSREVHHIARTLGIYYRVPTRMVIATQSLEDFDEEIDNAEIVGDSEPDEDMYVDGDEDEDEDEDDIDLDGLDDEFNYDDLDSAALDDSDSDSDRVATDSDDSDSDNDQEAAATALCNRELASAFLECVGPSMWRSHVCLTVFSQAPSKGFSNLTGHLYRDHEADVIGCRRN